jgi:hypothetical protein
MIAPSCTFTLCPSLIEFTSPRNTALNHTLQSSPITISPQSVAFGAMKQLFPHEGFFPFISNKKGIEWKI